MKKSQLMMYKKYRFVLVVFFAVSLITIGSACKKLQPFEPDPTKAILGKWEYVENPSYYREYLKDSTLNISYYGDDRVYNLKYYWIDTILYERYTLSDGATLTSNYRCYFEENNNRLKIIAFWPPAIMPTPPYKRIR